MFAQKAWNSDITCAEIVLKPRSILCVPYCCRTNHKQLENWLQMKLMWLKWKQTKRFCELTTSVFSNILHHILKTILNIDIFHFVFKNPLVISMWKKLQKYSPNYHFLFQKLFDSFSLTLQTECQIYLLHLLQFQ